ncbi:copper chaperone PCu(A)C [Asticcacaulis sp. EMRT-3]|uniref:copper chaperone PCu(A)C n=1 Tax=Asticcacaulis sp. EMRT-3 TaxID=3040349 RepID=UPI0024AEFBD8|nr:copper chaperone PCu(A)C [Asticcacaulis sp. EMRT-3]MDI7775844.1 copper chaperone PCu(A)C [Asticcacaulis sp. EMRT-3]
MKPLMITAAAALIVSGCTAKTEVSKATSDNGVTSVSTTVTINGNKQHTALKLTDYAMRAALGNNPNTAAYVTVSNTGDKPDRLVSAACACATTTSLHTMTMNGTMMEMGDAKNGFVIAPGQTITLKPGGNHIMLMGLTERPKDGDVVDVTLNFEKAGPITLHMPVSMTPLASQGAGGDDMSGMKM